MQLQTTQNIQQAIASIQALPMPRQQQIFDFIDMVRVYETQINGENLPKKDPNTTEKTPKNAGKFSDIFGMVKAKNSVSLEDMDTAIRQRGAKL